MIAAVGVLWLAAVAAVAFMFLLSAVVSYFDDRRVDQAYRLGFTRGHRHATHELAATVDEIRALPEVET